MRTAEGEGDHIGDFHCVAGHTPIPAPTDRSASEAVSLTSPAPGALIRSRTTSVAVIARSRFTANLEVVWIMPDLQGGDLVDGEQLGAARNFHL